MDLSAGAHLAAAGAAVLAGAVNAVAGGGTLITFPVLTAVGVPAVRANATNTVALCPGYVGGTLAQRRDLAGLGRGLRLQMVVAAVGGLTGSLLLVLTSEAVFRRIVPFLILGACALLATQDRLRARLARRRAGRADDAGLSHPLELAAVYGAAIYGGYFGAGLGIMMLAILGLLSDLPFTRLNAVKQLSSFVINTTAALFLAFSGKVVWSVALVMAPASLVGGAVGGRFAGSLPPARLRAVVITFGVVVAVVYLVR